MQILLPRSDGRLVPLAMKASPIAPAGPAPAFNRSVYAAAHVVIDPLATTYPWDGPPAIDWEATLAFREHLYRLGFKVAEAMDTAQRGMGLDWPSARELIQRSARHARAVGGQLACGAGTDQLAAQPGVTLAQVEGAYREQMDVVQAEGCPVVLMASRALVQAARGPQDYLQLYDRLLDAADQPVVLHWLGEMFDPALRGYWGSTDLVQALDTVAALIAAKAPKVEGIKVSLLDAQWERALRRRLPAGVKMYTGDDFHYAELMAGDGTAAGEGGHSTACWASSTPSPRWRPWRWPNWPRAAADASGNCWIPRWRCRARFFARPRGTTRQASCSWPGSMATRSTSPWPGQCSLHAGPCTLPRCSSWPMPAVRWRTRNGPARA